MALTKIGGDVIQQPFNVGIVTASTINVGSAVTIDTGGFRVGTSDLHSTGITVRNVNSTGVITATTFLGSLTGNVTGNATGLSGTPNITVGAINASSAVISGNVSVAGTITYEDTTNVDSIGVITARSGIHVTGGSIGIGTNNPTSKLQVVGSTDLTKLNLSGISSSISSTATDVFVYDTRKDSDGGAWRKRTQNTSWYNETLNTATRGSRKDFPAVAVIVATTSSVTIYDGDDPDMPMWMVFNSGSGKDKIFNRPQFWSSSAVYALNGIISITNSQSAAESTLTIRYVNDSATLYPVAGYSSYGGVYSFGISGRSNSSGTFRTISQGIVNSPTNDVAMTVLPNAPIDAATGLPVPTIAVATAGGVSVIKDDGSVVDLYRSSGNEFSHNVAFDDNNSLFFSWGTTNGQERHLAYYETIPSSDDTELTDNYYPSANLGSSAFGLNGQGIIANNGRDFAGSDNKEYLVRLYHTKESATSNTSSIAGITTSYNTGWMHGDIKGAFLSDTDITDAVGTELVTGWVNGSTYAYDTLTTSGSTITSAISDGSDFAGAVTNAMSFISGKKYVASFSLTINSGSVLSFVFFGTNQSGGGSLSLGNYLTNIGSGSHSITFTAPSTGTYYLIMQSNNGASENFTTGPVSVRLAEPDRSVNNKGLQVFGTITKQPVAGAGATAAELVAYSGFSSTNHLLQPNITPPGTGDFSLCFWIRPETFNVGTGNYFHLFSLGTTSVGTGFVLKMTTTTENSNGYGPYFYSGDGTQDKSTYASENHFKLGVWNHCVAMRKSGIPYFYINGVLVRTGTSWTQNITDTYLTIGRGIGYNEYGGDAKVSLLRYSLSVPSPEQIKKIYNDEKVIFQENAKCTLYGSSDAVTALAYDDDNQLLHVGTSSGRSDFQGLRRINNTTTAVTTAISASNGLIAEQ